MNEGLLGIIILVFISIICSVVAHWYFDKFNFAIAFSTLASVLLFQLISYIQIGYLEPFFIIALITSSIFAIVISFLISIPFRYSRRNKM